MATRWSPRATLCRGAMSIPTPRQRPSPPTDPRRRRPQATSSTTSASETHDDIDRLHDVGALYLGERERLQAVLDGNLRHRDVVDRSDSITRHKNKLIWIISTGKPLA